MSACQSGTRQWTATFVVASVLAWATVIASGCGTLTSTRSIDVDAQERWALLPIENLSSTPLAGRKAAAVVETYLRSRGVSRIASYRPATPATLVAFLADDTGSRDAATWARRNGHRYALDGTVHEWSYKRAPDREPAVGLTLTLSDVGSGAVLWQGTASRSGWGNASLSSVADRVVRELLDELRVQLPDGS